MFDVIIERIKSCVGKQVYDRLYDASEESTVVRIEPKEYDGKVCRSALSVVCVAKTYDKALTSFDMVCEGLDSLPETENEVLDISLENTIIKYDTVSGMVKIFGTFKCYTEVFGSGIS